MNVISGAAIIADAFGNLLAGDITEEEVLQEIPLEAIEAVFNYMKYNNEFCWKETLECGYDPLSEMKSWRTHLMYISDRWITAHRIWWLYEAKKLYENGELK